MNLPLTRLLVLPLLFGAGAVFATENPLPHADELPGPVPISRYQSILDKSPFAPPTAAVVAPITEATPSFAQDLYVTGVAKLSGGDFVTLSSRDHSRHFALATGENFDGMTLASIEWAQEIGKSKVTLKKGSEFGVVAFDEAATQTAPPPGEGAQPPVAQVMTPQPQVGGAPASVPPMRRRGPLIQPTSGPFRQISPPNQPSLLRGRPRVIQTKPVPVR